MRALRSPFVAQVYSIIGFRPTSSVPRIREVVENLLHAADSGQQADRDESSDPARSNATSIIILTRVRSLVK